MTAIPSRHLATALRLSPRELIALIGGGGKSTLLFQLARSLQGSTIVTTTTKMGEFQTGGFEVFDAQDFESLRLQKRHEPVFIRHGVRNNKSIGVRPEFCDEWFEDESICDNLLVEADGARHRPFKAPANFEPVFPLLTTVVLSVIGADALGRVIADQCHRPLRVAAVAGCSPYERLTPQRAATVLTAPNGAMKGSPEAARKVVVITKVPAHDDDPLTASLVAELQASLAGAIEVVSVEYEQLG